MCSRPLPEFVPSPAPCYCPRLIAAGFARISEGTPMSDHPAVREIYVRRLGSEDAARRFLRGTLAGAPVPEDLPGMAAAADRIERALRADQRIAVFGHDDPDGITSAAVLVETLEDLGGRVSSYVPDRELEGHGLYPDLVRRFRERGADLLVTTDGCSTNRAEISLAFSLGLDVVVTDHHEVPRGLPVPDLLVNPKADPRTAEAFGDLTGAGVAWLLARELRSRAGRPDEEALALLDLVALGTVADFADLGHSNRYLAVEGLRRVERGDRPAIAAAREALSLSPRDLATPPSIRRLAAVFSALPAVAGDSRGLDALLGRPTWRSDVDVLVDAFARAQAEIEEVVDRVVREAERSGMLAGAPAVVRLENASPRAIGRGASRLVEITSRPAAVLLRHRGKLTGELRGPEGVNLVEILGALKSCLENWGGHRQAAGFSAAIEREAEIAGGLAAAFAELPDVRSESRTDPDARLSTAEIDVSFLRSLERAAPFGRGNPAPVFVIDGKETLEADELLDRFSLSPQPQ